MQAKIAKFNALLASEKGYTRLWNKTDDELLALTQSVAAAAKSDGLPMAALIRTGFSSYGYGSYRDLSLPLWLAKIPKTLKSIKYLLDQGVNPWLSAFDPKSTSKTDPFLRLSVEDMLNVLFAVPHIWNDLGILVRKTLIPSVVHWAPASSFDDLIRCGKAGYELKIKGSSSTSPGMLSSGDKDAVDAAQIFTLLSQTLRKRSELTPAQRAQLIQQEAVVDAFLRLKKDKTVAVVPEKIKKALTSAQKDRLLALNHLAHEHASDTALFTAALDVTPWLAEQPLAACVSHSRANSLFWTVLSSGKLDNIQKLAQLGANIWLASAQDGEPNAVLNCSHLIARSTGSDEYINYLAKILLAGAHMDDPSNPKERCLQQAHTAIKNASAYHVPTLEKLAAQIENLLLEDALSTCLPSAPPAKRRAAL